MANVVRLTTEAELRTIHTEAFINNTDKVNKVNEHSVLSGVIAGNAKTAKKALKDITLATNHLFPSDSSGAVLDKVARDHGLPRRLPASESSTFVRLRGEPGTIYQAGVHTVSGNNGIIFDLEDDVTIGVKGYDYVKVRSQQTGSISNIDAYNIVNVDPVPVGHIGVINEYAAQGGRDVEQDDVFRKRILEGPDVLAQKTLSMLTQAFIKINSNVLRVIYQGTSLNGKVRLSIASQNGIDFNPSELAELLEQGSQYFALTELNPIGTKSTGVELVNIEVQPIDISMRVDLFDPGQLESFVADCQAKFTKTVDFRFWDSSVNKVEWDDLLQIAKMSKGVRYIPDQYFFPNNDIVIDRNKLPRFRAFQVYDLEGNLIINQTGTLSPIFYPNEVNVNLQEVVL